MSLLIAKDLRLAYGSKVLLEDACFTVGPHDRIGLVGANGTGKSSLLKVLAGSLKPDAGALQWRRGARCGYLPQDVAELADGPLVDAVLSAVPGRDAMHRRRAELESALSESREEADQLELSQELADLLDALEHFEDRYGRHRAERILLGLGFRPEALARSTRTLSGGWRMRAALASLLLQDPDLLLLDEPTNHLDLPTLTWFDGFLRQSKKSMVLISHDRDFLNRQIGQVISLEVEGLRTYRGDYDDYRRQRAQEREDLLARAERQQKKRAEAEAFIERFGAKASKARQAQSRLKQLEKEEVIEVADERDTIRFSFPPVVRSGREVLTIKGLSHAYGEHVVYRNVDAQVLRGQRIAVVGLNGAGKTTLLKLIAEEISPTAGEITFGHNVERGYYAQHHADTLDPRSTILKEIRTLAPDKPEAWVRGVLGAFLFSGDDVDKPIGVLSGGERARVALAKLLVKPANLLLLDEPTNHLDLDSSEALIEALRSYDGTLIFVSHNRSFLNQLANQVWDVSHQSVAPFPGNLDDYLHHLAQQAAEDRSQTAPSPQAQPTALSDKDRRRLEAEARQKRSQALKPLQRKIGELEAAIAKLETEQKEREASLADPALYNDFERARPLMDAHRDGKAQLEGLYAEWETAQQALGEAEAALAASG